MAKVGIPPVFSYFKLLPFLWFIFFTYVAVTFARKVKDSPLFVGIFLFFLYFAGSFGYFFTLYHDKTIWGSSGILAMQSGHTLINLQYAFSLCFLLVICNLILNKKVSMRKTIFLGFLLFVNLGLKFYAGVISLFLVSLFYFVRFLLDEKRLKTLLQIGAILGFFVLGMFVFYDPISSFKSGSALSFVPFALIHPIIEEQKLFYLRDTVNARYYLQEQGIGPRLIWIEFLTLSIFIFFNLGTRFFGFLYLIKNVFLKKISEFEVSIFLTIVFATALTVLFVQKGEWWNTIQFFYYAIFLSNIFISLFIYELVSKKRITGLLLGGLLLILAVPINLDLIREFSRFPSPSYLPKQEIDALNFLKKQPDGVVFAPFYDKKIKEKLREPYPLFAYDDTSYVSAFSGKVQYLADLVQLRLMGVNYDARLKKSFSPDCSLLSEINYLYENKELQNIKNTFAPRQEKLKKIYSGQKINIYSIIK